ncbi:hypothetical protein D3C85_1492420 [compost metagenome]
MCAVAAKSCDSHSGVTTSSSAAYSQEPPNGDWKYQKQADETMCRPGPAKVFQPCASRFWPPPITSWMSRTLKARWLKRVPGALAFMKNTW